MTTREEKTAAERVATALEFLEHSDREFEAGDFPQGSEKLWGATSHVLIAIARERGWPFSKHDDLRLSVRRLAEELEGASLRPSFSVAEKFHSNFYRDFMDDSQIEHDRPLVHDFVNRLVAVLDMNRST